MGILETVVGSTYLWGRIAGSAAVSVAAARTAARTVKKRIVEWWVYVRRVCVVCPWVCDLGDLSRCLCL